MPGRGSSPDVSVVVPTRDRPEALRRCLAALARQEDCGTIEVIVVDDGSRNAARVAEVVSAAGLAGCLRLDGRGPAAARNAGVAVARGSVVCFTDDDCEPRPPWASLLARAITASAPIAGGQTVSGDRANPFDVAAERVTDYLRAHNFARDATRGFLASNNLACSRDVARRHRFDEAYGVGGEDRDWCVRVAAEGVPVLVPEAIVVHTPGLDLRGFWRRQVRYGRGAYRFAVTHRHRPGPLSFYAGLVRAGFRDGLRPGLLVVLAQIATLVGVLAAAREEHAWR